MEWKDWQREEADTAEELIENGFNGLADSLEGFSIIRDKKYYLMRGFATFEEYCKKRYNLNRLAGWRLLKVAEIEGETGIRLPGKQAVEVAKAPVGKRKAAIKEAQKIGKVTANTLKQAVEKVDKPKDLIADKEGNVVPEWLEDVFVRGPKEMQPLLAALKQIEQSVGERYKEDDLLWKRFPMSAFRVDIGNLKRTIKFSWPHAVCPYCRGEGEVVGDCTACKGDGWINKAQWERVPEDVK